MTIAGVVAGWYFSLNETNNPELEPFTYKRPRFPILSSFWRVLRYHFGSVAFGSLLIAFIQALRILLAYIQRQTKQQTNDSRLIKFIFCCVQCCLKCLQACVEMVTRNAYIYIAIKGVSFANAGKAVIKLIISNAATIAIVNTLCELIMFLGKALIAAACGWIAYAILDNVPRFKTGGVDEITSTWLIILVTVFFAYAVAASFMMVFDLAVDTVLVCYVTDMEENAERHGGDASFKVAAHVDPSKLDYAKQAPAGKGMNAPIAGKNPNMGDAPQAI
jgi:hypothetical protein